jgi:hypothetical protein
MAVFVTVSKFPMLSFGVPHALDYFTSSSYLFEGVLQVTGLFVNYFLEISSTEAFEKPTPANAGL